MTSVFISRVAGCAVAAVLGTFAGGIASANAADLGGNCCADLEERIAELEATTARKGNRKVKLEVSGHVNQAIMWWDDGVESNIYQPTNDNARSRFRFKGEAKIDSDFKAGYMIEIGVRGANSKRSTQDDDNGGVSGVDSNALDIRHNYWYVDSKKFGRVSVGLTGGASESVTETNLAATKDIAKYADMEDSGLGMIMLSNGVRGSANNDAQWRRMLRDGGDQPGEGRRYNMVRYDTPELMGFRATANWGEDDTWEVGAQFKGEFGGKGDDFKVAAAIAYGENTDATGGQVGFQCPGNAPTRDADCQQLGGSVSVMHSPTGIYVNFGAGYMQDNLIGQDVGLSVTERAASEDRHTFWAGEVGIEKKWNDLGKTTVFFQYFDHQGGSLDRVMFGNDVLSSEMQAIGGGVIQGIDAAAMHVYLTYRHYDGEVVNEIGTFELDPLDVVMGGAIIRF